MEHVKERFKKYVQLAEELAELRRATVDLWPAELVEAETDLVRLQTRVQSLREKFWADNKELQEDVEMAEDAVNQALSMLKHEIYDLPIETLSEGISLEEGNFKIRVNKAKPQVEYDVDQLSIVFPDILEMSVDGDRVVYYSADPSMVERLVEMGKVPRHLANRYRKVTKLRNPAVTITGGSDDS